MYVFMYMYYIQLYLSEIYRVTVYLSVSAFVHIHI